MVIALLANVLHLLAEGSVNSATIDKGRYDEHPIQAEHELFVGSCDDPGRLGKNKEERQTHSLLVVHRASVAKERDVRE